MRQNINFTNIIVKVEKLEYIFLPPLTWFLINDQIFIINQKSSFMIWVGPKFSFECSNLVKFFNLFLRWNFWWSLPYFDRATYLRIRVWRAKKGIPKFFSCCGLFFIMVTIKTVKNHFKPLKFSKTVKKGPQNFLPLPGFL